MGNVTDKAAYLAETKEQIAEAITAKGVQVNAEDTFRSYADKITQIQAGADIDAPVVNISAPFNVTKGVPFYESGFYYPHTGIPARGGTWYGIAVSDDGLTCVIGFSTAPRVSVYSWNAAVVAFEKTADLADPGATVYDVDISQDKNIILIAYDGGVWKYDLKGGVYVRDTTFPSPSGRCYSARMSGDGNKIVYSCELTPFTGLLVKEGDTYVQKTLSPAPAYRCKGAGISEDGNTIYTCLYSQGELYVYRFNGTDYTLMWSEAGIGTITASGMDRNANLIAVSTSNTPLIHTFRLDEIGTGYTRQDIAGAFGYANAVKVIKDGNRILASTQVPNYDNPVAIFDTAGRDFYNNLYVKEALAPSGGTGWGIGCSYNGERAVWGGNGNGYIFLRIPVYALKKPDMHGNAYIPLTDALQGETVEAYKI